MVVLAASAELVVVAIAAYSAAALYHRLVLFDPPEASKYILQSIFISVLQLLVSVGLRQYSRIQTQPRHVFLWSGASSVFFVFSLFISTIFLLKISDGFSRATVIAQAASVLLAVLCTRTVWFSLLQPAIASGLIEARRIILIGDSSHCSDFSARVFGSGIRTIRSFEFPAVGLNSSTMLSAGEAFPHAHQLVSACRPLRADDIVILSSEADVPAALVLAEALSELPLDVHVVPVGAIDLMAMSRITQFGNTVTMRIFQCPLTQFNRAVKRAFDVVTSIAGLVLACPVFVIIPILIKLDSRGPVLFRQTRHGYNTEPIRVLKFRSMIVMEDGDNFSPAVRGDERVTRVGRFLRRTNLDELPQLFNVLIGDMSLVGPRPHATSQNEEFARLIGSFHRRHNVKPGITGWAQVNGYRGNVDTLEKMRRRVEYDLFYIDNWSLLLDVKIVILTLFSRKVYRNAY
nr:undecaprenyl-phosphate glucose phosphotransferase [Bradyrhizobium iriomotense]